MRCSVWLHGRRSWADLVAVAEHASATGWEGIWFGDEAGPALECWTVVAALSAAVTGVRLGALVDPDRDRHPAVVAKLAATVDQLSGGRLTLGLAAGRHPDGPARLEEACQVVTSLVGRDRTTIRGRFYRLHDAPLDPKPRQRPFPLLIVDDGDTTARLAARYATGWSVTGPPAAVAGQIVAVRRLCRDMGRDPGELAISVRAGGGPPAGTVELRDRLERYRDAGVDEWVLSDRSIAEERRLDTLDRIISEVAPAVR